MTKELNHLYAITSLVLFTLTRMQLNLALTYASRTQHHSLARHISDLIHTKASQVEQESSSSDVESESEDKVYMENRTNALKQRVQLGNRAISGTSSSKQAMASLRTKPPNNHHLDKKKRSIHSLSNAHLTASKQDTRWREGEMEAAMASDETRELFSDREEGESGGEEMRVRDEGEGVRGVGEETSPPFTPVQLSTETAANKRPNPFKVSVHGEHVHRRVL